MEDLERKGEKLDEVEGMWHRERKQVVALREDLETWKTKHEEIMAKAKLVNTLVTIKKTIWSYILANSSQY
jgi:hypothetical protein